VPSDEEIVHEFNTGWIEFNIRQVGLLHQLYGLAVDPPVVGGNGGSADKPHSKPPYDMEAMDFFDQCREEVHDVVYRDKSCKHLAELRLIARRKLGYDSPIIALANVSCHGCGSQLVVAEDASTAVSCTNKDCDIDYPTTVWLDLLQQKVDNEKSN
jgi:hypothetical protein